LGLEAARSTAQAGNDGETPSREFNRVPALDGVRAIAIIAVLLFHHYQFDSQNTGAWTGGFLGVDVFFVLSGFLITSLLLHEHARKGRIDLSQFWSRRARRLLPALIALFVVEAVLARFVLEPLAASRLRGEGIATLLYVENWHRITVPPSGLSHTWSLSVEEQWYLIWPLLLVFLLSNSGHRVGRLVRPVAVLTIASAVACAVLFRGVGERSYYGTDTRAQALLVGSGLAIVLFSRPTRKPVLREAGGWLALGILAWMFYVVRSDQALLYRGGFLFAALLAALLIASLVQTQSAPLARVLAWRPIAVVGLISYGLYLYHYPVYLWLTPERTRLTPFALLALRVGVTAVAAILSYHFVEKPFRRMPRFTRKHVLGFALAGVLALGLIFVATPSTVASPVAKTETMLARARSSTPKGVRRVFVAGDQTAFDLAVHGFFDNGVIRGAAYGAFGCDVMPGDPVVGTTRYPRARDCAQLVQSLRRLTLAYEPAIAVLVLGPEEARDRFIGNERLIGGSNEFRAAVLTRLDRVRDALTSTDARFVLLSVQCDSATDVPNDRAAWLNDILKAYARTHPSRVEYRPARVRACDRPTTDVPATWNRIAALLR
jgi:peptidoglycan/LPS O-acetylase OafA/YrhL